MVNKFDKGFLYSKDDKRRTYETASTDLVSEPYRSSFRTDYARLMHSPAFRRLQGKTQLFPGNESDFFRNRITHSFEVAQIAKSIACKINYETPPFNRNVTKTRNWLIDTDLVEFAGLAHDLGHPPFGHNGEAALDECMRKHGGFEGNAQTLRILTRIEKKILAPNPTNKPVNTNGVDFRQGLNLSFRTLASVLKYDKRIPRDDNRDEIVKGYYHSEADLVQQIKEAVTGVKGYEGGFKTIECSIMDLADDIAYSTYDLEDALKAGFLSLLDLLTLDQKPEVLDEVTRKVWNRTIGSNDKIGKGVNLEALNGAKEEQFLQLKKDVFRSLIGIASTIFVITGDAVKAKETQELVDRINNSDQITSMEEAALYSMAYASALAYQKDGYLRTKFTSRLVGGFIRGVQFNINDDHLSLSNVSLGDDLFLKIESLKNYVYCTHIMSPRLQVREHRGKDFVDGIFESLIKPGGHRLLPSDWQALFLAFDEQDWRRRTVCDYIAGMTDSYALEFYGRLYSENPQTIFKDH